MSYNPDPDAELTDVQFTALLSERDLALQVPINFVGLPGLSLTKSCFSTGIYQDAPAIKCFSNLIAASISSFEIDVYWDYTQRSWSLCPFQLGESAESANGTSSVIGSQSTSTSGGSSSQTSSTSTASTPLQLNNQRRQDSPATAPTVGAALPAQTLRTGSTTESARPAATDSSLVVAQPYSCSKQIDFALFLQVLEDWLYSTENTYNASLQYLYLNVHAAAPRSRPAGAANLVEELNLPGTNESLTSVFSRNLPSLPSFLYTPRDLSTQRAALNGTGNWYSYPLVWEPDSGYFQIEGSGMTTSTQDGWPGEGFVELRQSKRALAAFSRIDPQMSGYDATNSDSSIFPPGYLSAQRQVTLGAGGGITSGCFFDPASTSVSAMNTSWAMSTLPNTTDLDLLLSSSRNFTSCGISPFLNQTLPGGNADTNITPYLNYSLTASWAWAAGEPRNYTDPSQANIRCAAVNITTGRWQAAACGANLYPACKPSNNNNPYTWIIGNDNAIYGRVDRTCPDNSYFSVPRTALENAHLVSTWRDWRNRRRADGDDTGSDLLWVNMNSLDEPLCWVVGQTSSCPYVNTAKPQDRTVVVPTVAAVIVFVIAALMVFVKCAANRQATRRRKRRLDDKDYEGIPS